MEIKWEVEDGYVGKSRPQYTEVPDEEIAECETLDEKIDLIDSYIHEDFMDKISYSWDFSILD